MNIDFYKTHLETLADLQRIAEKHNCEIHFGTKSNNSTDLDNEILKQNKVSDKIIEILGFETNCGVKNINTNNDSVWFELYDKEKDNYHTMSFSENETYFTLDKFYFNDLEDEDQDLFEEFCDNELTESGIDDLFGRFSYCPTIMNGWGNGRVEDFRVYRPGMALKFFSDLVCDYLNEPRIERVY